MEKKHSGDSSKRSMSKKRWRDYSELKEIMGNTMAKGNVWSLIKSWI